MDLTRVKQMVDDLDLKIEAERADLLRLVTESGARTVSLMLQRERLSAALDSVNSAMGRADHVGPTVQAAQVSADAPARHEIPYMPGRGAKLILAALERAGDRGLSGAEVNQAVKDGGLSLDASEKTKSRLKKAGAVEHDERTKHWWIKGRRPS